jgi:hypothetical protein
MLSDQSGRSSRQKAKGKMQKAPASEMGRARLPQKVFSGPPGHLDEDSNGNSRFNKEVKTLISDIRSQGTHIITWMVRTIREVKSPAECICTNSEREALRKRGR